ncbi:hypothetical protein M3I54_42630 [Paraburkholderia sp. CNPSo 3274]|uniref:hypothetical protein n=1 Tax=Paraburkholderia sp. CNPSo 3274 TaxID=2940932 RepID=UPI0020B64982|nr:hypothetical protein [Paraburkholderia sp. CNPSo 3274]MCP3713461.1 hypothetical protein [Paraburkholderia sp. CNPSo 3274]
MTLPRAVRLPGRTRAVEIAVIVPFKVVDVERKHTPDIARELFHDRETFRAARQAIFRIPLALCPSDRADPALQPRQDRSMEISVAHASCTHFRQPAHKL